MNARDIQLMIPEECWFDAPAQRSARFAPVFSEVAMALHQTLRDVVPELYFRDPAKLADTKYAYPMLVFKASRTCRNRVNLCCWDVLDPACMHDFFRFARRNMADPIAGAHAAATAAQLPDTARDYDPRAVKRIFKATRMNRTHRKALNNMLVIEAALLHELIALAQPCPREARAKRVGTFNKRWNFLLRRFCGVFDFTGLGPQLLDAATAALIRAERRFRNRPTELDWAA